MNPALAQLERITSQEAASGLKAALEKGSTAAVAALGRTDGYFGNPQVKIPLPESMQLFVDSVRKMTVQDAKGVLQGGDTAGTEYFRRSTQGELRKRFLPIVKQATRKVDLAQQYDNFADKGVALGLVRKEDANLDDYVTQKALDGLFFMVGEEEKKIRKDPVGAGASIIRKVFGALAQNAQR